MANQRKIGVLLTYVAQFSQIFVNLIYTPIMLRLVGQSEYGLYQMVASVVSNLNLLSFGFQTAYIRYYFRYKAQENDQKINTLNGTFTVLFAGIAAFAAIIGGILVRNAGLVLGDGLSASELLIARKLMALMVINLVLTFPISVFDCYISAQERFVFQKVLLIGQYILNPIMTLPLLLLGYGSVAMISVTTVFTTVKLFVIAYYSVVILKMRFSLCGFRFSLLQEMGNFTVFVFLGQIIDQINWSVDKFLLGRYVGTAAVAVYGLGSLINNMYLQFSSAISDVFVPKINILVSRENDDRKITELFTEVGRIQFFVLSLALLGFYSIGKPFMHLWGGLEYTESYYIALCLMIPMTIPLIQNLGIDIQRAKNMHQARTIVYLFIAIGNVLISIPLIWIWGAIGATIGTAVSLIFGNGLFMNWYYHKKIGLNIISFWKEIGTILPSLLIPYIVGIIICRFAKITTWLQLIGYGFVIAAVHFLCIYFLGFNNYEKELVHSVWARFMKKRMIK